MNSAKWTWIAIGYLTVYAYVVAFTVYQIGLMFTQGFTFATLIALALLAAGIYLLVRGNPYDKNPRPSKSTHNAGNIIVRLSCGHHRLRVEGTRPGKRAKLRLHCGHCGSSDACHKH
jgi:membrane protein implicated in regulation of membrane protease activity